MLSTAIKTDHLWCCFDMERHSLVFVMLKSAELAESWHRMFIAVISDIFFDRSYGNSGRLHCDIYLTVLAFRECKVISLVC